MELKDTTNMMNSKDYKERFIAEYLQVKIRYEKLSSIVNKWDRGKLNFQPTCPRETYTRQLKFMSNYIGVLEERAVYEDIDLSKYNESKGE